MRDSSHKVGRGGSDTVPYREILTNLGLPFHLRAPWAVVGNADRVQGWKLHLSSIPTEAVSLLSLVVPFLKDQRVSFKIVQDAGDLCKLNEGTFGDTQIGKFATIYPSSDEAALRLAQELIDITRGFHGPFVATDLRLGDIVYARFGGFSPVTDRDRLGQNRLFIYAADGSLRHDAYTVPFSPPSDVPNPFEGLSKTALTPGERIGETRVAGESKKLLGPGYLILETIKEHPRGSVFRGIDLRSPERLGIRIIKQGRQHCLSDAYGRDMRTRLRRQEELHRLLGGTGAVPKADPYFEEEGDGYLPLEYVEGCDIDTLAGEVLAGRSWASVPVQTQLHLLSIVERLTDTLARIHSAGYVHRDLTASNVWIAKNGDVLLLDLELAHEIGDPAPAFGMGTPGFVSPEQEEGSAPDFGDDTYSLCCVLVLLFTGLDPRRALYGGQSNRANQLRILIGGMPEGLLGAIAQCLCEPRERRPALGSIRQAVREAIDSLTEIRTAGTSVLSGPALDDEVIEQMRSVVAGGQRGLLEAVMTQEGSGLWLSAPLGRHDTGLVEASQCEVRRSANRGVAGPIYLLSRIARFGYGSERAATRVRQAADWLLGEEPAPDDRMPGLHFGEAGMAVALAEAISSGYIFRNDHIDSFLRRALSGPLDWPDVTHGAAGQGIAALYCADRISDPGLLDLSHRCAAYLIDSQNPDGSWKMPPGVDGMSGQTITGFAHGVAGIVYFLAEYSRRFGGPAENAWRAGVEWLIGEARPTVNGEALQWSYATNVEEPWFWWCHGGPGISLTFLRLYELSRDRRFADIARKALRGHPIDIRYHNLSQCHGLSGLGDIYLEAYRVLGEGEFWDRAASVARLLVHLRRESEAGAVTWLVEDPYNAYGDLMAGCSGVIHFLLRTTLRGDQAGMPLLLDPLESPV